MHSLKLSPVTAQVSIYGILYVDANCSPSSFVTSRSKSDLLPIRTAGTHCFS